MVNEGKSLSSHSISSAYIPKHEKTSIALFSPLSSDLRYLLSWEGGREVYSRIHLFYVSLYVTYLFFVSYPLNNPLIGLVYMFVNSLGSLAHPP